ncbi:MAG: DUF4149 domain-containing protein [Povalibacter sp.]
MNPVASNSPTWHRIAGVLIALWAGSLWTICAIVAPTLFAVLDNRHLAGDLAARFFHLETYLGVGIGAVVLALSYFGKIQTLSRTAAFIAAGLPLLSQLVLSPLMQDARAVGNMTRFGMLHGISAACFLVASVALIVLTWKFIRPAE